METVSNQKGWWISLSVWDAYPLDQRK